eukprot:31152-Chlamydomonas_euryale.AAC.2
MRNGAHRGRLPAMDRLGASAGLRAETRRGLSRRGCSQCDETGSRAQRLAAGAVAHVAAPPLRHVQAMPNQRTFGLRVRFSPNVASRFPTRDQTRCEQLLQAMLGFGRQMSCPA